MKKQIGIWILTFLLIFEMISPVCVQAEELYVFTRETLPCYSDEYGSSRAGSLPKYHGAKVEQKSGSYHLVTYTKNEKKRTGWITHEDYRDWCLEYDGSEIPVVATGTYQMGGQKVIITFLGDGEYYIQLEDNKQYLSAVGNSVNASLSFRTQKDYEGNLWIFDRTDHNLTIQNKKTGLYLIPEGSVIRMTGFHQAKKYCWILTRQGTNADPYRNFLQYDGRWGNKRYGRSTKMAASACGILAVVNAAFALNGQFIEPMEAAQYAYEKGYRVENNGTDEDFLKAFVRDLGKKYGICYDGKAETLSGIKKTLKNEGVVTAHVPGHYVCIADYKEKKDRYLILDPHPITKRKTSPFGSWKSERRLETGSLAVSTSFIYRKTKEETFRWDMQEQELEVIQVIASNHMSGEIKEVFERLLDREGR